MTGTWMYGALSWRGPLSVNVFVVGAGNTPLPDEAFRLAGLVPDAVLPYPLQEQPEAVRPLGLVSYDVDFDDTSLDLRDYTRAVLRRLCADTPAVAWAAFEGTFDYDELLGDRVADQVYGHCAHHAEPAVARDAEVLRSEEWRRGVAGARAALDALLAGQEAPGGR